MHALNSKELRQLSGVTFNAIDAEMPADEVVKGDQYLEKKLASEIERIRKEVETALSENKGRLSKKKIHAGVRARILALFGQSEEKAVPLDVPLTPRQARFIARFMESNENIGLGFRTGAGKTRTFLEVAREYLGQNHHQLILISTPLTTIAPQIVNEIGRYSSLAPLANRICREKPFAQNETDVDVLERLSIQHEEASQEEFLAAAQQKLPEYGKNIIIATPQRISALLKSRAIDPKRVGLLILDEAGVGSKAQTGKFDTFSIVDSLKANGANFRILAADATPTAFAYYQKKFGVAKWDFGEDPLFTNLHANRIEVLESPPAHEATCKEFVPLLRASYRSMREALARSSIKIAVELPPHAQDSSVPYLTHEELDTIGDAIVAQARKAGKKERNEWYRTLDTVIAFRLTQQLLQRLRTSSHYSVAAKIKEYEEEFAQGERKKMHRLRLLLQLREGQKSAEKSPLVTFKKELEAKIHAGEENPKIPKLRELLEKLKAEGKRVLVLCEHLKTADYLNHCSQQQWQMRTAVIHGSTGGRAKNAKLQQYVFEGFRRGEIDAIFATSVAERGLDMPEIDSVIVYSPARNVETELQCMGRMRKGGTMITLATDGDKVKAFTNKKKRNAFIEDRKKYDFDASRESEVLETAECASSKFRGRPKSSFFVEELVRSAGNSLNIAVSERFRIAAIESPRIDREFGGYTVRVVLEDRTGRIPYYYSFQTIEEARQRFSELSVGTPVIANGRLVRSSNGKPYLAGRYRAAYFEEGVILCPEQDADMQALIWTDSPSQRLEPAVSPQVQPPQRNCVLKKSTEARKPKPRAPRSQLELQFKS